MSTSLQGLTLYAAPAGEDLSSALFHFASVDTDGRIILAGDGAYAIGVIIEGNTENRPVSVQCDGIGKVKLGATLDAGVAVGPSASPEGCAVSGGTNGVLLTGGQAGEIVSVLLR
jgi:hypothetical protein